MEHGFSWLEWVSERWPFSLRITAANAHVATSLLVLGILAFVALWVWRRVRVPSRYLLPSEKVTLTGICDVIVEAVLGLMEDIMGPAARKHLPLIGTIFIYVLVSNLIGLIPGMSPPTANMNTNLAIGAVVFVYYNAMGIREHGFVNYLKHFMGPMLWIAPLVFSIELVSHLIRPLSLSIRLFGNMVADHAVVGVFTDLTKLVIPAIFLGLGLFVCFIQAFVFSLLSTVYIALATAHEEHE